MACSGSLPTAQRCSSMEGVSIKPYLNFSGQCDEAFRFYGSVLGARPSILRYGDLDTPTPEEFKSLVIHASLSLGVYELEGADVVPGFGEALSMGNNFAVSLQLPSVSAGQTLYEALMVGGEAIIPYAEQDFGSIGMLRDRYGIRWLLTYKHE